MQDDFNVLQGARRPASSASVRRCFEILLSCTDCEQQKMRGSCQYIVVATAAAFLSHIPLTLVAIYQRKPTERQWSNAAFAG
jgi:hypothetical protein